MKQTAVQFLLENIVITSSKNLVNIIKQSIEMEKEQIIDAHLDGQCFSTAIEEFDYAEDYYNETYNK